MWHRSAERGGRLLAPKGVYGIRLQRVEACADSPARCRDAVELGGSMEPRIVAKPRSRGEIGGQPRRQRDSIAANLGEQLRLNLEAELEQVASIDQDRRA